MTRKERSLDTYDVGGDYSGLSEDVKYDMERFKDPYVVGAMIHRLVEERKYTNQILRDISKKLNQLLEQRAVDPDTEVSDVDQEILKLVEKLGKVTAADVQKELKYKGKNAASARLNALSKKGLLRKARSGRKVIYKK